MKTNKLAAGALALALGLGAVTPAFAESTGDYLNNQVTQEVKDKINKIESLIARANELDKLIKDSQASLEVKEKELEEVKKEFAKTASDADADKVNALDEAAKTANEAVSEAENEYAKALKAVEEAKKEEKEAAEAAAKEAKDELEAKKEEANKAQAEADKARKEFEEANANKAKVKELSAKITVLEGEIANLNETIRTAKQELGVDEAAESNKTTIKEQLEALKNSLSKGAKNDVELLTLLAKAKELGILTDEVEKPESKEEVLAKAEKAYDDARVTVKAVELIKVTAPKVYENNKVAIDAYLEKANAAINKLGKALGKKVAISDVLFSTAYAAEEASLEEIEDLTKEVEEVDKEGKELLENINKQEEEADKEDENKDKPADDKKDNEEKPADDEKDEKEDDKKADDKKDEKKPAAKKASSNAKTGVAGVTGVAGILAAASVAYAASKKRD